MRALFLLAGECREFGDDPATWVHHFARGVAGLVGGDFAATWQVAGLVERDIAAHGVREWGWDNGFDREGWLKSVAEFKVDPFYTPEYERYFTRLAADDGVCLSRSDLTPDAEWDQSWLYQNVSRPMGAGHHLWCVRAVPGVPGSHLGLTVVRGPRGRDFTAREKAIVHEAQQMIAGLVGGPLASFAEPSPADLPPRARQVLKCFLEGDSDKQAAARLGLSVNTVAWYAKQIHRHFGVQSRSELLARWVKRQWGARCAWADGPPGG